MLETGVSVTVHTFFVQHLSCNPKENNSDKTEQIETLKLLETEMIKTK